MKDTKKRQKGSYKEEYSKIIYGKKVHVIETTKIGRDYEVLNFTREYSPAVPIILKDGSFINKYTSNENGDETQIIETTICKNGKVIDFIKERS